MTVPLPLIHWVLALLVSGPPIKGIPPADSLAAAVTPDTTGSTGPVLGVLVPTGIPGRVDSLSWWPPGLEDALMPVASVIRQRERGLRCVAHGDFHPGHPGLVMNGIPVSWPLELGGDVSIVAGAACAELSLGPSPPWLAGGLSTIRLAPWQAVVISPLTGVQVLRGDHNERSYAVGISTGVTSSVFSLLSVALSKGDGVRTNSDFSRSHYDIRLDLKPPLLAACRVVAHRGTTERGVPGPDPRLWPSTDGSSQPLNPRFWAEGRGFGAEDAMWSDDRETITTGLLALQFDMNIRDRPLMLAVLSDAVDVVRTRSVPILTQTPSRTVAYGDLDARRNDVIVRMPLVVAETESVWAGLSIERVRRDVAVTWVSDDSTWQETVIERPHVVRGGLGLGGGGVSASLVANSSANGTTLSWSAGADREVAGMQWRAGAAGAMEDRRLEDLWLERLAGVDTVPDTRGTLSTAWVSLARESPLGSLTIGTVAGWGRKVWGWCEAEDLPPGQVRRWGPARPTAGGMFAAWQTALLGGVRLRVRMQSVPWREGDDPLPGWPTTTGMGTLTYGRVLGRAARPEVSLTARYVGQCYAGAGRTLPLDPYWQLNAIGTLEIGDFTLRTHVENLTGHRHQDERGYPVEGLRFRAGFTWLFWD